MPLNPPLSGFMSCSISFLVQKCSYNAGMVGQRWGESIHWLQTVVPSHHALLVTVRQEQETQHWFVGEICIFNDEYWNRWE